jgi:hypothetical protein
LISRNSLALVALRKRQQRNVPGLFDGSRNATLMRCADTRQPAGNDFPAFSDKALQQTHVAVRDCIDLFNAELANFLAAEKLAPAWAGNSCGTRRPRASGAGRWCGLRSFFCHGATPFLVLVPKFFFGGKLRCSKSVAGTTVLVRRSG